MCPLKICNAKHPEGFIFFESIEQSLSSIMGSGLTSSCFPHHHSSSSPSHYLPESPTPLPKSYNLPSRRPSRVASFIKSTPNLSHYHIGPIIGKGGFGKIFEVRRKQDDQWFALKSFDLCTSALREVKSAVNELLVLNRIPSHPFIIQLHAAFRDRTTISFIMDLLEGGDVRLLIRCGEKFSENKIAYLVACIGSAIHHVHLHKVIHRDIKPENIMFTTNGTPKLIDFGTSFLLSAKSNVCVCHLRSGTTQYISPEAFASETNCHGYESDYWSLGIVMYELLYSTRPYETNPPLEIVNYSERTYKIAWNSLRTLAANEFLHDEVLNSSQNSSPFPINEFTPYESISTISSASIVGMLNFFSVDEEEVALRLDLIIPLPLLSAFNELPSANCLSLLSSLLEVRIHKRLGVGENYTLFTDHPFFASFDLGAHQILSSPSPIHPDIDQIKLVLWNHFLPINLDEFDSIPNNQSHPNKEIETYLRNINSSPPLFHVA